jgi:hypothetical protein
VERAEELIANLEKCNALVEQLLSERNI